MTASARTWTDVCDDMVRSSREIIAAVDALEREGKAGAHELRLRDSLRTGIETYERSKAAAQ